MILFLSFVSFLILLILLKKFSIKFNLIDKPNTRKIHVGKIPLIGGLIIYINIFFYLPFLKVSSELQWLFYVTIIIVVVSVIDDAKELGVNLRLITQVICSLILIGHGVYITELGLFNNLFSIEVSFLSFLFTVICIMGLTNAFNFIDGLDGLCSTQFIISLLSIIFFMYYFDKLFFFTDLYFIIFIILNVFLFLIFNLSKKFKIFLGDSGSLFLGFFISGLLIIISQNDENLLHPVLTIWCVTIPVFEFFSVVVRRSILGINPFKSDRRHLHHILVDNGLSNFYVIIFFIIISLILNLLGVIIFDKFGPEISTFLYFVLLIIYIIVSILFFKSKIN